MSGDRHSHSCGHAHSHDDKEGVERGNEFSLYLKIDLDSLQCLNEAEEGSGRTVFKPWDQRKDVEKFVESDADEELLFSIPFTGSIKLKGIIVIGGEDDYHPSEMKLYKNRPNMTFDDTAVKPEQIFALQPDHEGILEYKTQVARFNAVEHLSIFFPKNFGADTTKVYYIGLRGDYQEAHKHGVTITTYEARAMPSDHKSNLFDSVNHQIQ